ncbi:rhotekin isoform X2 [Latimeria chalumnae]|uniref:rhotekin isoform X2 n=1 Tax=Latimeria chalumnae TaxID=7897 RepID=UPI0006D907A4|nr:PREDICTED: rhotekin isoform X1 [Latimeria chalumnae]|eukprot:XP_014354125.1 PREDICTED: rhotekin isoform X1 [Latimeria chalumnae]
MEEKLRILEDLNMLYIRQIALSLQVFQDSDIQKKIDYEIRMRDGTCKLLAACTQREQALEAAKGLLTCNARIMAYMSELQKMKEAQVMQRASRRPSDVGPTSDRQPCKGKVAISDLRIPLMWKDTEYFKNKGDPHRCAVFCLLRVGAEIHDTEMVLVDRTLTDICFESGIVFGEAGPDFEMRVEIYSCCVEEDFCSSNTPKKLASKLSSSLGRSSGKKVRAALEGSGGSPVSNGGSSPILLPAPTVIGPKYHLLAHMMLTLTNVQDSFRTHDLTILGNEDCSFWLPLYGSLCCRLAAQPNCMTQRMMSGFLNLQQLSGDQQNWKKMYCVLRGTNLFCYRSLEEAEGSVEPAFTIAVNKETSVRAAEKDAKNRVHGMSITNRYGGEEVTHTLMAENQEQKQRWMEAFWQHFFDMSQWKQCCDDLMKIEMPSPRKPPALLSKQGSLYHEMIIDSPDDIATVTDILARRMQELETRRDMDSPPWLSLFEGPQEPAICRNLLTMSDASITSDSDSAYSASPCMYRAQKTGPSDQGAPRNGSARDFKDWDGREPHQIRPRTLSLDAKLTSLKSQAQNAEASEAAPRKHVVLFSASSSGSNSSGSTTPDSETGYFSRPAPGRQSLRNIRTKLDPRNWLQTQV